MDPVAPAELSKNKVIVLDHFEFNIDNPESNRRRLELLEHLLYEHKANVVILSTIDPLYYLAEERAKILDDKPAIATQLFDRWSRALSKFKKVEFADLSAGELIVAKTLSQLNKYHDPMPMLELGCRILLIGDEWRQQLKSVLDGLTTRKNDLFERARSKQIIVGDLFTTKDQIAFVTTLDMMEQAVGRGCGSIFIFSPVDPESSTQFWGVADPLEDSTLSSRWHEVLRSFTILDLTVKTGDEGVGVELRGSGRVEDVLNFADLIVRECDFTAYLRRIGRAMFVEYVNSPQRIDQIKTQTDLARVLLDRVDSYYGILWASFTEKERLVLYQLAKDGWANPMNERAIQQLQRKEFICKVARYRIMNESFRLFVLSISDFSEVASWQREGDESSWRSLRTALIMLFVGLGAWLLYAQKDLFQVTLTYIVTLGGALTGIMNALAGLGRKGGSRSGLV